MKLHTRLCICRAGMTCCYTGTVAGLAWVLNIGLAIAHAPADVTAVWLVWQVVRTLIAIAATLAIDTLSVVLELWQRDLEREAYLRTATSGMMPRDWRHTV